MNETCPKCSSNKIDFKDLKQRYVYDADGDLIKVMDREMICEKCHYTWGSSQIIGICRKKNIELEV